MSLPLCFFLDDGIVDLERASLWRGAPAMRLLLLFLFYFFLDYCNAASFLSPYSQSRMQDRCSILVDSCHDVYAPAGLSLVVVESRPDGVVDGVAAVVPSRVLPLPLIHVSY